MADSSALVAEATRLPTVRCGGCDCDMAAIGHNANVVSYVCELCHTCIDVTLPKRDGLLAALQGAEQRIAQVEPGMANPYHVEVDAEVVGQPPCRACGCPALAHPATNRPNGLPKGEQCACGRCSGYTQAPMGEI